PLNFLDWSEQQHAFASVAAVAGGGRTLTGNGGGAERIAGQAVTSRFFEVLGIRAVAGATFDPDDVARRPGVVVISERLWRSHFGGAAAAIGRAITLDGQPFTIIGVVPAGFQILYPSDIWTPFVPRRSPEQRRQHYMQVIGRLKPGVTLDQAKTDMGGVADEIARVAPDTNKDWGVTIEPLRDAIVGSDLRTTSLVLPGFDMRVAAVAVVLTLGTALLFGLVPAWQASNVPLAEMTSAGGRGSTRRGGGLRAALVIGEVAAAVLLLSGAGLLVRTLIALS